MGSIVLLDEHTVNKIAAGEVVDRPASIVKELVENSIDAKATAITVEIKNGGISYIKITDNGIGFAKDDVEMAFERHATSKIRKEEDLLKITSMGFRGEALASIAAISKVTLLTKSKDENIGTKVEVAAGKILSVEPAASVTGTKIEIHDVFYNVPARFKFLKKDFTEAGYIEDAVIRAALANPSVSFKYINNGKVILQTSGNTDLKSTVFDLFGKEIYQNLIDIDYELNNMKIQGVIGLPSVSRSTRMHQFTFINSRFVKDKVINSAIDKACQQKYAINKFAFAVINIKMNPSNIDVNVHPAKLEVKFENEAEVFDLIYYGIKSTIERDNKQKSPFIAIKEEEIEQNEIKNESINQISKDLVNTGVIKKDVNKKFDFNVAEPKKAEYKIESLNVNTEMSSGNILNDKNTDNNLPKVDNKKNTKEVINEDIKEDIKEKNNIENIDSLKAEKENVENVEKIDVQEEIICNLVDNKDEILYKYIGQVFDTYIIIQIKEKMYIIDQHAAHERLLFEKFKKDYYAKDRSVQMLLIPTLVELMPKEKEIVNQNTEMFEKSGFVIEDFGDNAIKISGVPNIGYEIDYKSMFKDIIDELLGETKTEKSEKEFRFIATLACKAAVKGNMKLNREEQIELIDKMVKLDNPFTCPHGRPTAYELSKYEIERRFLRK